MSFSVVRRGLSGSSAFSSSDALHLLDGAGCALCRSREQAGRRWFAAYEDETRTDLAMRARLERSFGFCAAHTRQLFDLGASTSWLARWVFADVARAGHIALSSDVSSGYSAGGGSAVSSGTASGRSTRSGRPPGAAVGECPACTAEKSTISANARLLAGCLDDAVVVRTYREGDGLCVSHGLEVMRVARGDSARFVASDLIERLSAGAVIILTGRDPDARRRARIREADAEDDDAADCCPLCSVVSSTERRYLQWLATGAGGSSSGAHSASNAPGASGRQSVLCAGHLADLPASDPLGDPLGDAPGGPLGGPLASSGMHSAIADDLAALWCKELGVFLDRTTTSSARQTARIAAGVGVSLRCHLCELCREAVIRERHRLGLLADDPASRISLAEEHGACLRHGIIGGLPPIWQDILRGRIGLLAFELAESERKSGWDARWEARGDEMSAWQRAPWLLDGAVPLGSYYA